MSHAPVTDEFVTPVPEPVPVVPKGTKRVKRAKPKVPLPDDWEPTDAHRAMARQLSLDLHMEAEKFKSHHQSKDNRYADWGPGLPRMADTGQRIRNRPAGAEIDGRRA